MLHHLVSFCATLCYSASFVGYVVFFSFSCALCCIIHHLLCAILHQCVSLVLLYHFRVSCALRCVIQRLLSDRLYYSASFVCYVVSLSISRVLCCTFLKRVGRFFSFNFHVFIYIFSFHKKLATSFLVD